MSGRLFNKREQIQLLNASGDMPLINDRENWPWVNSVGLPGSNSAAFVSPEVNVCGESGW